MNQEKDRWIPRIESEIEVKAFLQDVNYAIDHGTTISFQIDRKVDGERDEKYTNRYTMAELFPNRDPVEVLKDELLKLTIEEYRCTLKDTKFPNKKEFREFGKIYRENDEVYIKFRLEMFNQDGLLSTFVMSFHFAEKPFLPEEFPYRKD